MSADIKSSWNTKLLIRFVKQEVTACLNQILVITDKVSKDKLVQLWDSNPKTISMTLDTFRVT